MRIRSRFIGPGIFLILIGAIPLAVREGLLEADQLAWSWRLWPLFLIAAGIGLLLRSTALRDLGGFLAAVLGGLIVGSVLASATSGGLGAIGCAPGTDEGAPFTAISGTFDGSGTTRLVLDCGTATVVARSGDTWDLSGRSADGGAPAVRSLGDLVSVRSPRGIGTAAGTPRWWRLALVVPDATEAYDLTLNGGSIRAALGTGAHELVSTVNAGELIADLSAASSLEALDVTVNAGTAALTLPDASVGGSITVNAGAVRICAPAGVGLRLTAKPGGLGGNDFGSRGLVGSEGVWTTPGWERAAHLIDLRTTANAGGFSLNPEGGCR